MGKNIQTIVIVSLKDVTDKRMRYGPVSDEFEQTLKGIIESFSSTLKADIGFQSHAESKFGSSIHSLHRQGHLYVCAVGSTIPRGAAYALLDEISALVGDNKSNLKSLETLAAKYEKPGESYIFGESADKDIPQILFGMGLLLFVAICMTKLLDTLRSLYIMIYILRKQQ